MPPKHAKGPAALAQKPLRVDGQFGRFSQAVVPFLRPWTQDVERQAPIRLLGGGRPAGRSAGPKKRRKLLLGEEEEPMILRPTSKKVLRPQRAEASCQGDSGEQAADHCVARSTERHDHGYPRPGGGIVKQLTPVDFFPDLDRPGTRSPRPPDHPGSSIAAPPAASRDRRSPCPPGNGGIRHTSVLQPGEGVVGAGLAVVCFPKR